MARKLKPCPFCGSEAIMTTGEYQPRYTEHEKEIPKGSRLLRQTKYPSGKTFYEYRQKAYIPQCTVKGCMGRIRKMFETEEEAARAWNGRADNGGN